MHVPRSTLHAPRPWPRAFTILELLVVIGIIGLIAGLVGPVLGNFKTNVTASATRQLLDDVARARQLAISQHTTVYMIFAPTNFWDNTVNPANVVWRSTNDWFEATNNLLDKQYIGYTYFSLHTMGDQPGNPSRHFLSSWRTLPEGSFIPLFKFSPNNVFYNLQTNPPAGPPVNGFQIYGFDRTTKIPFPLADTPVWNQNKQPYTALPYIAFDYLGRLVDDNNRPRQANALIPVAKGSVAFPRSPASKKPVLGPATFTENPPGNSTNAFNVVSIDWLTGRAHLDHVEVR